MVKAIVNPSAIDNKASEQIKDCSNVQRLKALF